MKTKKDQTILALDTATHCGYAVYKNGKVVAAGVWNLDRKTNDISNRHVNLYDRLNYIIDRWNVTHIVKEDVYLSHEDHRQDNAFKVLCELGGVVKAIAGLRGVSAIEIQTKCMQRFIFGRVLKREQAKQAMCNVMTRLGYELPSTHKDDMADALGLLFTYLQATITAD